MSWILSEREHEVLKILASNKKSTLFETKENISEEDLAIETNAVLNHEVCRNWLPEILWLYHNQRLKVLNLPSKYDDREYFKVFLDQLKEILKRQSINQDNLKPNDLSEAERKVNSLVLGEFERIKSKEPRISPSLNDCLDENDKYLIETKLEEYGKEELAVEELLKDLEKSPQYEILNNFKDSPGISKNIFQLSELREIASDTKSNKRYDAAASIKYFLEEDDIISDKDGLVGLIDDLYAINYVYKKLHPNLSFYELIQGHDNSYPSFSLPPVGNFRNLLPLTNIEDLVKASYFKETKEKILKRLLIVTEIGPLAILSAVGKSLTDRIEATKNLSNDQISFEEGMELNIGQQAGNYFGKASNTQINVIYQKGKGGGVHVVKDKNNQLLELENKHLANAVVALGKKNISSKQMINKWKNNHQVSREMWTKLQFRPDIKKISSQGKILIVSNKQNFEPFLLEEFYGKPISHWFGLVTFKRNLDPISKKLSKEMLFPEEQFFWASSSDQFLKSIDDHENEEIPFKISLIVFANTNLLSSELVHQKLSDCKIDTLVIGEVYKPEINTKLGQSGFEVISGSHDKYLPVDSRRKGPIASFFARTLKPNLEIEKIDNSLLDNLRTLRRKFPQDEWFLAVRYRHITEPFKRVLPLKFDELENYKIKFQRYLEDLEVNSRFNAEMKEIYNFLSENKEDIFKISRVNEIEKYVNRNQEKNFHLLCKNEQKDEIKKHFSSYKNIKAITMEELNVESKLDHLIIPHPFKNEENIKLRNYSYAQRHIFFTTKQEEKLHKYFRKKEDKLFGTSLGNKSFNSSSEFSKEAEEVMIDVDPSYEIKKTTVNTISQNYVSNTQKENIEVNLFFLEDSLIYLCPVGGEILRIPEDEKSRIEFIKSMEVQSGDKLVLAENLDGNSLLHASLKKDLASYENYLNIESQAKIWQKKLKDYAETNNFNPIQVASELSKIGVQRHHLTIKNWLNDPDTIRPRNIGDVSKIFNLVGEHNTQVLDECLKSMNKVMELRDTARENLISILENEEVKDNDSLSIEIGNEKFSFKIYEVDSTEKMEVDRSHVYKLENIDDLLEDI